MLLDAHAGLTTGGRASLYSYVDFIQIMVICPDARGGINAVEEIFVYECNVYMW